MNPAPPYEPPPAFSPFLENAEVISACVGVRRIYEAIGFSQYLHSHFAGARRASAWARGLTGRRAQRSKVCCSSSVNGKRGTGRPSRIMNLQLILTMHAEYHLVIYLLTQDTSVC